MSSTIEVILIKNIKGFGKLGETKKVRLGYARNFLIPQALALVVNDDNLNRFKSIKQKEEKRLVQEQADAEAIKNVLEGKKLHIKSKGLKSGKLYGSVTLQDIVKLIEKDYKVTLNKKQLTMPDHLKEAGDFTITVEPHPYVSFEMKLQIELEVDSSQETVKTAETTETAEVAEAAPEVEEVAPEPEVEEAVPEAAEDAPEEDINK